MLKKKKKGKIIKESQIHETDTGSPEVQASILTQKIKELSTHLRKHRKDKHSRRGLLGMVAKRKAHLNYLKKRNPKRLEILEKKIKNK